MMFLTRPNMDSLPVKRCRIRANPHGRGRRFEAHPAHHSFRYMLGEVPGARRSPCRASALYDGVGSLAPGDAPTVFALKWEWDGKHWTARQDIGPGPRVGHAMALVS